MIRILATAITLAVLSLPVAAQESATNVASASVVNGPVQVNQGEEFLPMRVGQALKAGDRVMALRNGAATIRFEDGCDLRVEPETMVTVPSTSTCAGGVVLAQAIAPASSEAVGVATAAGGVDTYGAAIIIGTVLVGDAIMFAQEDRKNTVSP